MMPWGHRETFLLKSQRFRGAHVSRSPLWVLCQAASSGTCSTNTFSLLMCFQLLAVDGRMWPDLVG